MHAKDERRTHDRYFSFCHEASSMTYQGRCDLRCNTQYHNILSVHCQIIPHQIHERITCVCDDSKANNKCLRYNLTPQFPAKLIPYNQQPSRTSGKPSPWLPEQQIPTPSLFQRQYTKHYKGSNIENFHPEVKNSISHKTQENHHCIK